MVSLVRLLVIADSADSPKTESEGLESGQPVDFSADKEVMEGDDAQREQNDEDSEVTQEEAEITENVGECTFCYESLKAKSSDPIRGINYKQREVCICKSNYKKEKEKEKMVQRIQLLRILHLQAYLADAEFETIFGMTKEAFYQQPKWKQDLQKKKVDLF